MANLKKFFTRHFSLLLLLIIFLASSYYLCQPGFFYVHDYTIGAKIVEMANALKSWRWPVRWSANFGYGFGMPLFNFYAPLPYIIGAIFYLLSSELVLSIKFLYVLLNLLTLIGSFKLGKKIAGTWGGLLLAAAFTLAPYRALNLFVRGALSEAFAMSLFPWVILALYKKNHLLLFVSLVAIILSHNLSALMFIPLAALWSLLLLKKKELWSVIKVFILAFLSTIFYSLPSFLEKDLTKMNEIVTGYFDYHLHFLYIRQFLQNNWGYGGSSWGANDDISFFLGYGQLLALVLIVILLIIQLLRVWQKKGLANFFNKNKILLLSGFITLMSLFLSTTKSLQFWENLKILAFIQFPWRWLGSASFFLALFLAIGSSLITSQLWKNIVCGLLLVALLLNASFFRAEKILKDSGPFYYSDAQLIRSEMSKTLPDYIPIQMADEQILQTYNQKYPEPAIWPDQELSNEQTLTGQLLKANNHSQTWKIIASDENLINFKIANFSGWTAEIDEQAIDILENPQLGNIQLLIPAGEHLLQLDFRENKLRLLCDYISLISLVTFIGWQIILKNKSTN